MKIIKGFLKIQAKIVFLLLFFIHLPIPVIHTKSFYAKNKQEKRETEIKGWGRNFWTTLSSR